jgi:hypothetical protein
VGDLASSVLGEAGGRENGMVSMEMTHQRESEDTKNRVAEFGRYVTSNLAHS